MKYLLDANAFYWCDQEPDRLSVTARARIEDLSSTLYLSVVSVWELQIKLGIGKLQLQDPLSEIVCRQVEVNELVVLRVTLSHVLALERLPHHHKDPFDRLLIAQAMIEDVTIISADKVFAHYPIKLEW